MTEGIPYFSLDCRFDDKLEEIEDMFGMKGLGIIIKLFQKIYGIHGYYCEWNDRVASRLRSFPTTLSRRCSTTNFCRCTNA